MTDTHAGPLQAPQTLVMAQQLMGIQLPASPPQFPHRGFATRVRRSLDSCRENELMGSNPLAAVGAAPQACSMEVESEQIAMHAHAHLMWACADVSNLGIAGHAVEPVGRRCTQTRTQRIRRRGSAAALLP
jgi:hypothetical protein